MAIVKRDHKLRAHLSRSNGTTGQVTVETGTSATLVPASADLGDHGVFVKALSTNIDTVFAGIGTAASDVTLATGMELNPGEGITFNIDSLDKIYTISATAAQKVSYVLT